MLAELGDGVEGRAVQRLSFEDREPDLDLVEPGCPRRREMELHGGVTLQPVAILGLVGIEVVEDDVDGGVRVSSDDAVHELEKLTRRRRFL